MKPLVEQLTQYAAYHRDRRNIATHVIGIPMIVVATAILLSRPRLDAFGIIVTPALIFTVCSALYYLALDLRYGVVMTLLMGLALWSAQWVAAQPTWTWLTSGIGLFVVGWIFQFVGHAYEGKKPAFIDDLIGLIIGPLFVVAEIGFALGIGKALRHAIERRVGTTHGHQANALNKPQ